MRSTKGLSKIFRVHTLILLGAMATSAVHAQETDPAIEKITGQLKARLPSLQIDSVTPSAVPGLYEVMMGPRLVYMSADGRYLVSGDMTDLETGNNLTELKTAAANIRAVEQVGEANMIVFGSEDAEHTINVFTDIDCGYCRKLHSQMDGYNKLGIRVRYLFYPRAGIGSEAYDKAVSVWCSEDRKKAMTSAKSGEKLPKDSCKNPVEDHYALGKLLGVSGTPALVLNNGKMIPGYLPPARLKKRLDEQSSIN